MNNYKIAVAGTGYVGLSVAALLSQHNKVTAVYIVPEKVDLINRTIKKKHIDVVYTNVAVIFLGAIAATFSRNCKSVWHIREIIKNKMERNVISFIVNHFADIIIANSWATGDAICKDRRKVRIVYNAVEDKDHPVIHMEKKDVTVGMAGRINRWKGQKLFVDMADIVRRERPDVRFRIAGSAFAGEEYMEEDLKNYISSKELSDCIDLVCQVTDMDGFYQSLDIFILPSTQQEPFGLVVIEAMEKKLPVIATNHGGPVEIIDDGVSGYLVPYENAETMAERCIELCDDWKLRDKIGSNAQKKKRKAFSLENTVKKIDDILTAM